VSKKLKIQMKSVKWSETKAKNYHIIQK